MKKGLTHKRIPTILALVLVFIGLSVTMFLVQNQSNLIGRATPDTAPQAVNISNITDTSFTVSFTTNQKVRTAVSINEIGKPSQSFFDDRNINGASDSFFSHIITVNNLSPETSYQFSILSEGETFLDKGQPFVIKTGPRLSGAGLSLGEFSGKVIMPDSTNANDTIAKVEIDGAQVLATVTDTNGIYKFNLNNLRTQDLTKYVLEKPATLTITFMRQALRSTIKTATTVKIIPTALLSYQYDFSNLAIVDIGTSSSLLKVAQDGSGEIAIINPKEGQSYIDSRLTISGTSPASQNVRITISPSTIPITVVSSTGGFWSYRPTAPLSVGQHRLTIQTLDEFGILRTITRNFGIFPAGSTVNQTATPSATTQPTQTPTRTPTPTVKPSPTQAQVPTPTTSQTNTIPTQTAATPTPTSSQTQILPTPTSVASNPISTPTPAVLAKVPDAPGSTTSIIFTTLSILLVVGGAAILFML